MGAKSSAEYAAPTVLELLQLQRLARHILRGNVEFNVFRADMMKLLGHDVMGEFGLVAFAAQVGKVKMFQVSGHDLGGGFGGVHVREMPVAAQDALFEAPWTARAILQHFHVVIGFQNKDVC